MSPSKQRHTQEEVWAITDAALLRCEEASPDNRRATFFVELAKLPQPSREREDFLLYGRAQFAPGPYEHAEFLVLHPESNTPRRQRTTEELRHERIEAEHYAARDAAQEAWFKALEELRSKEHIAGEEQPNGSKKKTAAQLSEIEKLRRAAKDRQEEYHAAAVRCTPPELEKAFAKASS